MKYFIDTEFSEMGSNHPITLISIAIVAEDGIVGSTNQAQVIG